MIRKILVGATMSGALALGSVGVASAASPAPGSSTSPPAHHFKCSNAPAVLARLSERQADLSKRLDNAQKAEERARDAGKVELAKAIEKRIQRIEARQSQLSDRIQKIEDVCPGATANGPSTGSASGSTSTGSASGSTANGSSSTPPASNG